MGQLFFTDENGRRWMCGWDNPSQGYYARRYNDKPDPCLTCEIDCEDENVECPNPDYMDFDISIGFGKGHPNLDELQEWLTPCGFVLEGWQRAHMTHDRFLDEHSLTPLQKNVHAMFEGLL